MTDIHHRIGVQSSSPDDVYAALTTIDGLSGWWTTDTHGDPDLGGKIEFRFPEGGFDMEVVELTPGEVVRWRVTDGPREWIGTFVDWRLSRSDGFTIVRFTHEGWAEPVEFLSHCSTKWAVFLLSLKALIETGTGSPPRRPPDQRLALRSGAGHRLDDAGEHGRAGGEVEPGEPEPLGPEARTGAELDAAAAERLRRVVAEIERPAVEPGEVRRVGHGVADVG